MKRSGLTMIELIFSMVIIGIVFSVVPKIIFASNKSLELSIKEDGMYNAISLLGTISKLPWDENTIQSGGKILHTPYTPSKDCLNGYRVGGFIGSRNCIDSSYNISSFMGQDGLDDFNDTDDFNGKTDFNESSSKGKDYDLSVSVTKDNLDENIKNIVVTVIGGAKTGNFQTSFFYESANLGHIQINKRAW